MVLDSSLLNTQHYKVRINEKMDIVRTDNQIKKQNGTYHIYLRGMQYFNNNGLLFAILTENNLDQREMTTEHNDTNDSTQNSGRQMKIQPE